MDIFFVAAGPRYVRRRPGTTAVTAYPPALLLAASRASSINVGFDELDVPAY